MEPLSEDELELDELLSEDELLESLLPQLKLEELDEPDELSESELPQLEPPE
jgi:hypothetical protein